MPVIPNGLISYVQVLDDLRALWAIQVDCDTSDHFGPFWSTSSCRHIVLDVVVSACVSCDISVGYEHVSVRFGSQDMIIEMAYKSDTRL